MMFSELSGVVRNGSVRKRPRQISTTSESTHMPTSLNDEVGLLDDGRAITTVCCMAHR